LTNVSFRECDATAAGLESGSFDAVVCAFGVFFAADMPAFVAEMWRLVRPGGTLAITTWGPDWCEPAASVFWESVRELEPKLFRAFNPWDEITTAPALAELLARGGISGATVEATAGERHELERRRTSGTSRSARATAPPSMRSATSSVPGSASASSASSAHIAS
jgi:SAM-dependent methyltransferase